MYSFMYNARHLQSYIFIYNCLKFYISHILHFFRNPVSLEFCFRGYLKIKRCKIYIVIGLSAYSPFQVFFLPVYYRFHMLTFPLV